MNWFYRNKNVLILCFIFLITPIGGLGIAPGIPKIADVFNISPSSVYLINTIFTIPGILLCPFVGILIDRYGRKLFLVPALFIYGLFGLLMFWINSFQMFLIFRFFQGLGVSIVIILNTAIIGDMEIAASSFFNRSKFFGIKASLLGLGGILWPLFGGYLSEKEWNYPFFLFILPIIAGMVVLLFFDSPTEKDQQNFRNWFKGIRLLLNNRQLLFLFLIVFTSASIFVGAYLTYFPILMSHNFNISSSFIGIILASMYLPVIIFSLQIENLNKYFSINSIYNIIITLQIVALLLIPIIRNNWGFFSPAIMLGVSHGILLPMNDIYLTRIGGENYRASIVSLSRFIHQLGQTAGPFLMGMVFVLTGIKIVFYAGAVFCIIVLILIKYFSENIE